MGTAKKFAKGEGERRSKIHTNSVKLLLSISAH